MREILVLDILQYCKLLNFVKQNEFSFKLNAKVKNRRGSSRANAR